MADAVLSFAVNTISTFLTEEGTLLGGLRHEVQLIGDEFGHIMAFLQKMTDFNDDLQLAEWIRQVREVSYDTQDILDEFHLLFVAHHHRQLPGFHASMRRTIESTKSFPARRKLASKLQRVKARISNIAEARLRYESQYANILSQVAANGVIASRNDDALLVEEAQLVGIEKPKQHLISQALDGDASQLKAIAVLGMGGLGKTTLARKIYEDDAVKSHFQIRAWITVSQSCDIQNLLHGLIRQLVRQLNEQIPPEMDSMDSHDLKGILKGLLLRGRYAVVFDDVWHTEFWDEMKFVLPENSYGGNCVMFTTRNSGVATASNGYVYRMQCLSFQDSWSLFCNRIFKGRHCPADLKDVAESIVNKCDGLPLGIGAIGGLLASKDPTTKKEWELIRDRLGDEFQCTGKLGQLKRIFSLSYNDLPSNLKAVLLYTSIFPPGQDIRCSYLIHLLVAEGFVEPKRAQTAEDSAWDCLKELANRSLIQPYEVTVNGLFRFSSIHDLFRDFIALKSKEQNMVTTVSNTDQISGGWQHPQKVVRRLVFDRCLLEIPSTESHLYIKKCRSIISFGRKNSPTKATLAKLLCSNILTVVDLGGIDSEDIPEEIFKLLQLKFFCISGKRIRTVPKSIQRLQNLQFLFLIETSVRELPVEIRKLHKLRHLQLHQQANGFGLGRSGFKAPPGIGELAELQILDAIDAAGMMSEIGKLTKLRTLCVTNLRREDGEELCFSLNKLNSLQELIVASSAKADEVVSFDLNYPIYASSLQSLCLLQLFGSLEKIPPWIRNLQGLEAITLSLSNLAEDPLETLQHLPNLVKIRLMTEAYLGELLCFKAGRFLKLEKLRLKCMKRLRNVRIEKGAMPVINELWMEGLPLVEELPVGIQRLMKLQELNLWSMNPQLIKKLEIGADSEEHTEDYEKISHVPQVTIGYNIEGRWESHRLSRKKKVHVKKEYQVRLHAEETQNAQIVPLPRIGRSFAILLLPFSLLVVLAMLLSFTSF